VIARGLRSCRPAGGVVKTRTDASVSYESRGRLASLGPQACVFCGRGLLASVYNAKECTGEVYASGQNGLYTRQDEQEYDVCGLRVRKQVRKVSM